MTREQFISNLSHWNSYLPLLWTAITVVPGDIVELGMGDGSTEKLHNYLSDDRKEPWRKLIKKVNKNLYSYEGNLEWYKKFEHLRSNWHQIEYVGTNWQILHEQQCGKQIGVLFSDEAPGEMRKYNISMFCNTAQVIIAHDADESTDHGYKYSLVKPLFKYHKLHEYPGASTIALSNFVDVSKWVI